MKRLLIVGSAFVSLLGIVGGITFATTYRSPDDAPVLLPVLPPCSTTTIIDHMTALDQVDPTKGWKFDSGNGGSGSASLVSGQGSQSGDMAIKLTYNLGTEKYAYVQIKREFPRPLDPSAGDHLRFLYTGTQPNSIQIGVVSDEDLNPPEFRNYFNVTWKRTTHVPWLTYATWDFKGFLKGDQPFPNSHKIAGVFISVIKLKKDDGGAGSLIVDELQWVNVAGRQVPVGFENITVNPGVTQRAAAWISKQQQADTPQQKRGLLKSWYEEQTPDYAWLYDQALGLIVLSKTDLPRANKLAATLHDLRLANPDGVWYESYHYLDNTPFTPLNPIEKNEKVGPIAWVVYGLMQYASKASSSNAATARQDALAGAEWLKTNKFPMGV
jgi:hypothetical protein